MSRPLDDLEMFEVLHAAYPEKVPDETNASWAAAMDLAEELGGFDVIADLLGRVACLTMPMKSPLSETWAHCLGRVEVIDGKAMMTAAVRREFKP